MDKKLDEIAEFASGSVLCNLAIAATLLDKGVIDRTDLMDMIDILIDWSSVHFGKNEVVALYKLRDMLEATEGNTTMRQVFETVFYEDHLPDSKI